ncbi:hypothetical protein V8017_18485 [Stenotrophomonas rhizophila]
MQVDLLQPEAQRGAPGAEGLYLHAQHAPVEIAGGVDVGHGEHEVVEAVDMQVGHGSAARRGNRHVTPATGNAR